MEWLHQVVSPHALTGAIATAAPLAFGLMALAGLVMGFAPSTMVLAPVVAGIVFGEERRERRRAVTLSLAFVLGIATVDAALGGLFGLLGQPVVEAAARAVPVWDLVIAAVLVVMGLALLRRVHLPLQLMERRLRQTDTLAGAYVLGVPFGLSTCPACTPMVLPALGAAAVSGSVVLGAALLFVFGLARGTPLLLAGVSTGALSRARPLSRVMPMIERGVGWVLLALSVFFLVDAARRLGLLAF